MHIGKLIAIKLRKRQLIEIKKKKKGFYQMFSNIFSKLKIYFYVRKPFLL